MIENPKSNYSGLTIVMDSPSRFDLKSLLSGYSGDWFQNCLLADPKYIVYKGNCQARTLDEPSPLLPGTKTMLLLGEKSLARYKQGVTLNEQRGSPFTNLDGITCIATYTPQDCFDRKDYFAAEQDSDSDGDSDEAKTTHGRTQRKNWKFWSRQDIRKAVRLTREPLKLVEPGYVFYPDADMLIDILTTTKNKDFYFDIETDSCLQLTCFGFSFGSTVFVVPMLQTHLVPRSYYYDNQTTCRLLRALSVAICNNTVVIHNSMFDLFVLVWRYGLPIGNRVFDTMLAHNRCFIEIEKSLGHAISLYTDLPYHKNEGIWEPHDRAQADQLYAYNGKDVYAMTLLKPAILERAASLEATESVGQVNRMVVPYLTSSLQGMNVDWKATEKIKSHNERMQYQIERILKILTGLAEFNPNSPKQVAHYLYDTLGLKKPVKDLTNEKTLLQHQLKLEIPVISCVLEYRKLDKQSSKITFTPWRGLYHPDKYLPDGEPNPTWKGENRFTTSWKLAGTDTMRLGSAKLLSLWGNNSQNYEKKLRATIIPD